MSVIPTLLRLSTVCIYWIIMIWCVMHWRGADLQLSNNRRSRSRFFKNMIEVQHVDDIIPFAGL